MYGWVVLILWLVVIFIIGILIYRYETYTESSCEWLVVDDDEWDDFIADSRSNTRTSSNKARCCVVCYEDRTKDEFKKTRRINQDYCDKMGYDFRYYTTYNAEYPPYWMKVKIIHDILMSGKYQYVMWIDSDACIVTPIPIERIFTLGDDNTFMVMTPDPPPHSCEFNAGVWIVKNSTKGRNFMADWLNIYDRELHKYWSKSDDKWICRQYKIIPCRWGRGAYEQTTAVNAMIQPEYAPGILQLPHYAMQGHILNERAFSLHFMGNLTLKIMDLPI